MATKILDFLGNEFPYRIGTRVRFQHEVKDTTEWLVGYVIGKQAQGAYQDVLVPNFGRDGTVYQVHNCAMKPCGS